MKDSAASKQPHASSVFDCFTLAAMAATAGDPGTAAPGQGTLVEKQGTDLRIYLNRSAVGDSSCSTVHLVLSCHAAAAYTPG
jgi:hypothetical protein